MPKPRKPALPAQKYIDPADVLPRDDDVQDMRDVAEALGEGATSAITIKIRDAIDKLRPQFRAWRQNAAIRPCSQDQHEALTRLANDAAQLADTLKALDTETRNALWQAFGEPAAREREFTEAPAAKLDASWRGRRRLTRLEVTLQDMPNAIATARSALRTPTRNTQALASAPFRRCVRELARTYMCATGRKIDLKARAGGFVAVLKVAVRIWDADYLTKDQLIGAVRAVRQAQRDIAETSNTETTRAALGA